MMKHEIDGIEYSVTELSLQDVLEEIPARLRAEYACGVHEIAASMEGRDRTAFLVAAAKDTPSTQECIEKADRWIGTMAGLQWLAGKCISPVPVLSVASLELFAPLLEKALPEKNSP